MDVATDPANRGRFEVEVWQDFAAEARKKQQDEYDARYGDTSDMSSYLFVVKPPITE